MNTPRLVFWFWTKAVGIVNRLKGINPDHTEDIKQILLDKTLSLEEKMEFLKLKINYVLKNVKSLFYF